MNSPIAESQTFFRDESAHPLGRLTLAGTIKNSSGISGGFRVFGQYALVLVVGGGGIYREANGQKIPVSRGDLIWVFPQIPHLYGPARGGNWDEIYVCFDGPIFDLWAREGLICPSRPVETRSDWREIYARLREFLEKPRPATPHERLISLHEFLAILAGIARPESDLQTQPEWFSRAKASLSSNLGTPWNGPALARELGQSYETLRKNFAKHGGVSPQRFRDGLRIEAAKSLLLRGETKSGAVARSLGFRDEAHLSRRFRELCGVSPREWLREQKRNAR